MKKEIICGLDIGATKLTAVVGEFGQNNRLRLLSKASLPSEGVEKGKILDMEKFTRTVEGIMNSVRLDRNLKPDRLVVGVSSDCLKIHNYRRTSTISERGREIKNADIEKLMTNALDMVLPLDHEMIHVFPQEFSVDGQNNIRNPRGMFGSKVSVRVLVMSAPVSFLHNIKRCIYNAGYDMDNIVFSGLGSGLSFLTEEERIQGVIFIEVGGGLTSLIKFKESCPVFLEVIPFGGLDIDKAIANAFGVPLGEAEELKNKYGNLNVNQPENKAVLDSLGKEVDRNKLNGIILSSTERLLFQIKRKLENYNLLQATPSGIVLGGRPFLLDGFVEKTEDFFRIPTRLGNVGKLEDWSKDNASLFYFASAIGLIYFDNSGKIKESCAVSGSRFLNRFIQRTKEIFEEYF